MQWLRLVLALLIMIPAWVILGALVTYDSGAPPWWGLTVGAVVGCFFGMAFGGNRRWRIWDSLFGPEDEEGRQEPD